MASLFLPILKRPSKKIKNENDYSIELSSDDLIEGYYYLNEYKEFDGDFVCCLDMFEMNHIDISMNYYYLIINYHYLSEDEINLNKTAKILSELS